MEGYSMQTPRQALMKNKEGKRYRYNRSQRENETQTINQRETEEIGGKQKNQGEKTRKNNQRETISTPKIANIHNPNLLEAEITQVFINKP